MARVSTLKMFYAPYSLLKSGSSISQITVVVVLSFLPCTSLSTTLHIFFNVYDYKLNILPYFISNILQRIDPSSILIHFSLSLTSV